MLELVLVVLALLALSEPAISIVFAVAAVGLSAWKQNKLRGQLRDLAELNTKQNDALHRELLELRRQITAAPPIADSAVEAQYAAPSTVRTPAQKATAPPVIHKPAEAAVILASPPPPAIEKKPVVVAQEIEKDAVAPVAAQVSAQKPVTPPIVTTPVVANPTVPQPPMVPVHKAEPTQPPSSATPLPLSRMEIPPSKKPSPPVAPTTSIPPPSSPVRVVASPQLAALHAPAATSAVPKATAQQRMKSVFALEEILGTNWLNKLGIVLVVFGVALFGIYELGQLGPAGKVGLSFVVSLALLVGGIFLEKRERYRVLGHTLIGGGWALLFFTTYAMNHVQAMRVMTSESTDLIFMLAVALAMVGHTLRYRSQLVTGLSFLLAYGTVALSNDDVYSLSSGVILAIGLVAIVIKMGWFELEVFGILSSYANHLYWLYRLLGPGGAEGRAFADYRASTAILLFYWITYRISYVVRKPKSPRDEHISTVAALLNTLLLLGSMKFQSVRPELAFMALLIIGAVEFSVGQLSMIKRRREAFVVLSVLGGALMIASVPFRYSGNNLAILWLIGAEAFLAAGVIVSEVVFRRLGLFIGLLVSLHLIGIDFQQLMVARRVSDDVVLAVGVMFTLCAVVFYLNALFVGRRWERFFSDSLDALMLRAHSYVGAFAAASAAWALFSGDWAALAFAGIMLTLAVLGQKLKSFHLQVQYGLLGLLTLYRVAAINLHTEVPQHTHVRARLITLPIIAAAFYLTAKWAARGNETNQGTFRGLFAFAGTGLMTALIYYEVPELWQPLAAIAFAVLLLEVGQRIGYPMLAWHTHLLGALAVLAAVTADPSGAQRWHDTPLHAFAALPVVAGAYWIARRISVPNQAHVNLGRIAYSWAGTGVMVWVLNEAIPAPWTAVSWIIFAAALARVMREIRYRQLGWQANAVAACSLVRAYTFNLELEHPFWQGISLRLVTISIVAAGLYFLSRQSTPPDSDFRRAVSYLHTFAATALLAFLACREAPSGWLAAVWAIFALVLALVDRRFELEDLGWQAHALAALTMVRSVTVNLYVTETWHGISVRLLSLAIVAVVFYALSRVIRMPEQLREREFHHIYSWAASALVSLLLWYELQPLSVAVGWAVFGLVLFQYGLWRKTRQFRFQAYVALAASFGRIFFANLTAETPGEFWGPRIYTVLPIALIYFFVYAQLGPEDQAARDDRGLHFDLLIAYLGVGTVVALLYFQFANEWLVTAWAVVVFILFGLALLLNRSIFLHQALLLTLGACTRGVMHNLFGASYFTGTDWIGRISVLGSAIVALLACLPFAFQWRDHHKGQPSSNWIGAVVRHPEQFMFFAPVLLLTLMLALKMRAGMVTVSWGLEGVLIVLLALAVKERSFRLTGFVLLLLCVGKLLVRDAWGLQARDRYITFIILGMALLLVSFLYTKYREAIRQFL